jgi:hypothetical protein
MPINIKRIGPAPEMEHQQFIKCAVKPLLSSALLRNATPALAYSASVQ